ncbi:hypothetical protein Bca4012_039710 [Brassica carinata]
MVSIICCCGRSAIVSCHQECLDLRRPCICGRVFGYQVICRAFSTMPQLSSLWFMSLEISTCLCFFHLEVFVLPIL